MISSVQTPCDSVVNKKNPENYRDPIIAFRNCLLKTPGQHDKCHFLAFSKIQIPETPVKKLPVGAINYQLHPDLKVFLNSSKIFTKSFGT